MSRLALIAACAAGLAAGCRSEEPGVPFAETAQESQVVADACAGNVVCDDGNPCTIDACDPAEGCTATAEANGVACQGCLGVCQSGACVASNLPCADGDSCTTDACVDGACAHFLLGALWCDDGDPCTVGEGCVDGKCAGGAQKSCGDGDLCTVDGCTKADGCIHLLVNPCMACTPSDCDDGDVCTEESCGDDGCVHVPFNSGKPCDDDNACTLMTVCMYGFCSGGVPRVCDAGPCMESSCSSKYGCQVTLAGDGASCEDGNPCTEPSTCQLGQCGGPVTCDDGNPCTFDACDLASGGCVPSPMTGFACDDGDPCTVSSTCQAGACTSGPAAICDDFDDCTADACVLGACVYAPLDAVACDDGSACTMATSCTAGVCGGGTVAVCPDDGNPCTSEVCDALKGCTHVPDQEGAPCGPAGCGIALTCKAGACAAGVNPCDDGDPCTADACTASGACASTAMSEGAICDDGDVCTFSSHCVGGACDGGSPVVCNDGNPCTTEVCVSPTGCQPTSLSDGTPCGTEGCGPAPTCESGSCISTVCDDGDPCTADVCVDGGCSNVPSSGATCDDGDMCTFGSTCVKGKCKGGQGVTCDDGNDCTDETCVSPYGCQKEAAPWGTACGGCGQVGTCYYQYCDLSFDPCDDDNSCTGDACDAATGQCIHWNHEGYGCDDGDACTVGTECIDGGCGGGSAKVCDDGSDCTADACVSSSGCKFAWLCDDGNACTADYCEDWWTGAGWDDKCEHYDKPAYTYCNDGFTCTTGDHCYQGTCVGQDLMQCNDGEPCTLPFCVQGFGCKYVLAPETVCDDEDPCTTDSCDAQSGCHNTPVPACAAIPCVPAGCDDGDPCTVDKCLAGTCGHKLDAKAKFCDDGNSCTEDKCTTLGCTSKPWHEGWYCVDGNTCSFNSACKDGVCVGKGTEVVCDDGNPCSLDVCLHPEGCSQSPAPGGIACDDGNPCTLDDACVGGSCKGDASNCDDGNPCTNDGCDPVTLACIHSPGSGATCSDGDVCTFDSVCLGGTCTGGKPVFCNDGNPCTLDVCVSPTGCVQSPMPDGTSCADASECTVDEHCQSGYCTLVKVACSQ